MNVSNKKAFTMIELVFVIVVIGILAGIAIPKFAATRDDAIVAKGKATLGAVRSAIATERQKRILRGDFTAITSLGEGFSAFSADNNSVTAPVLEYPVKSGCTTNGCWNGSAGTYTFYYQGGSCAYTLSNNRLTTTGCAVFGD